MATRKTKLPKPAGTDARQAIGTLDLNELDDLFDDLPGSKPGDPVTEFKSGLKEGFLGGLKTKDIVRNFLRSAAPQGFDRLFGAYDDVMASVTDIKDTVERTNAADLDYLGRKAQDYLPQLKDRIPNALYDNISAGLSRKVEQYQYELDSQRDQVAIRRRRQEEDDANVIKAALDQNTLVSKENFQRGEQGAVARAAVERAERGIRDKISAGRFDFMSRSMGMAVDSLTRMVGYNEQVNYGIQRKGLELQFRTFMGIRDLVKLQEANLELNNRAYEALVRNTGMPDYRKGNAKDLMTLNKGKNRPGFFGSIAGGIAQNLPGFLGNYGGAVNDRVSKGIGSRLSEIVSAMRMGDMAGGSMWDQRYSVAGQLAGELGSDFLKNTVVPWAGRRVRPTMEKLSNRMGGRHHQVGYALDNIPAFMQEFVNNYQNTYGIRGVFRDAMMPFVPQFHLKDRLEDGNYQTIDQGAAFNQLTQRSIVEVIPGFLARQLQELRMIRTGRDDIEREVFDITTGKFDVQSSADDRLQKKIVPAAAIRSTSGAINEALNAMDEEGKLSPQARKALAERMLRDASTNRRFDPEAYLRSGGYMDGLDAGTTDEIQRFFKGKFSYDDKGKMIDNAQNHKLRDEYSRAFLDIRSVSRDPVKEVHRLINAGQTEPLRMLGIIVTEQGQDRINYNRIWEIMRSGVTDGNPYTDGGYQPEFSGDINDKNFVGPAYPGMAKANAINAMRKFRNRYAPQEDAAKKELARFGRLAEGKYQYISGQYGPGIRDFANNMRNGQFGPYVAGIQGAFNNAGIAGQDLYSKARAGFGQHMDAFQQDPTQFALNQKAKIMDVFTKFNSSEPIIKGIDFVQGTLVDVNTKKVIESVQDITGKVVTSTGVTVLSAAEVAAGLFDNKGMRLELPAFVLDASDKIRRALMGQQTSPSDQFKEGGGQSPEAKAAEDDKQDWYIEGDDQPTITSRGLKNGEYYNADGDVITSMQDIKGDVLDKNGSIIATAKELASGLWSRATRKRWRLTKTGRRLANAVGWGGKFMATNTSTLVWSALKFGAKAAIGMGSALFNFAIETQNAYLPGDNTPVLERRLVKAGKYFDEKGKVIENFGDVYGPIFNEQGEPVLDPSQYKELLNYDGTKHILAKNKGFLRKTVWRGFRAARSKYIDASKKYMGWALKKTAKFYGGAAKKVLGGFAKAGGGVLGRIFERVPYEEFETQDQVLLGRILETLQAQMPEQLRAGSWQDKAEKAKEGAAGLMDKLKGKGEEGGEKAQNKLMKGLSDGLKGIFSKITGVEGEEGSGAFDVLMGGGMKGGAKGRLAGLAKRAVPWLLGGTAAAVGTGYMAYDYKKSGMDWGQTGLLTGLSLNPLGNLTSKYILKPMFGKMNDAKNAFRRLRMLQYGITDHDQQMQVQALEDAFDRYTERTDEPDFNVASVGGKEILSIMGIDIKNEVQVTRMSRWLEMRFKPVFLTWIKALGKIKKPEVKLVEIDEKVPTELKGALIEAVKIPVSGNSPLQYRIDPFSEEGELEDTVNDVVALQNQLTERYKAGAAKAKVDKKAAAAAGAKTADQVKDSVKKAVDGAMGTNAPSPLDPNKKTAMVPVKTAGGITMGGGMLMAQSATNTKLTALQSIRMRAYGLEVLAFFDVQAVLTAEGKFLEGLSMQGGVPEYRGDLETVMQETAPLFGKDIVGNDKDRVAYYSWFSDRFIPVARAYYGAIRNIVQGATTANMESKLKPSDYVTVANSILGTSTVDGASVWTIGSIFNVKGPLGDLKKLAEADLEQLKKDASKDVMSTPTQSAGDQAAGAQGAAAGGSFADKALAKISSTWDSAKKTVGNTWDKAKNVGSQAVDAVSDTAAMAKYNLGMAGEVSATGRTYGTLTKGNGGAWEQVPYPKANKSRSAAAPTFQAVAAMVGIPVELLFIFASLESGFDYTVKAKTSSASGWFQFINDTWDAMLRKHGSKYGIPADDASRSLRLDPRINALMGACFIKDNFTFLKGALGRDPTDVDLYIAHFMGPGGAKKFLTRNQDSIGASVFPEAAAANRPIFYKKSGQPRTLGEIYQMFEEKIAKHRGGAEGSSVNTQEAGKTMTDEEAAAEQAKANAKSAQAELWNTGAGDEAGNAALAREEQYSATGAAANTQVIPGVTPMPPSTTATPTQTGSNPSADSGISAAQAQQEAALQSAQQQNNMRQSEVRKNNEKAQQLDDIQAEQLKTLLQMRDHLKRLVELGEAQPGKTSEASATTGGNNNMTSTLMQTRQAQSRPTPLALT